MEYTKGVFFTIFSELTEIAEQPYREQLTPYDELINEFQKSNVVRSETSNSLFTIVLSTYDNFGS